MQRRRAGGAGGGGGAGGDGGGDGIVATEPSRSLFCTGQKLGAKTTCTEPFPGAIVL